MKKIIEASRMLDANTTRLNKALANIDSQNVQNLYTGVLSNIESMKNEIDSIGENFKKHIDNYDALFLEKLRNTLRLIDSETAQIIAQISKLRE